MAVRNTIISIVVIAGLVATAYLLNAMCAYYNAKRFAAEEQEWQNFLEEKNCQIVRVNRRDGTRTWFCNDAIEYVR